MPLLSIYLRHLYYDGGLIDSLSYQSVAEMIGLYLRYRTHMQLTDGDKDLTKTLGVLASSE